MSFDFTVLTANWSYFARGLAETAMICAVALPVGFVAGLGIAQLRLRGRKLNCIVRACVEVIRNVPFLIQVFLLFFALPFLGIRLEAATAGVIALAAYAAAYFSQIVRGALATIPAGQSEAAHALGLTSSQTFWRVLLPQLSGYILPAGGNLAIALVKESAVLSVITVRELTYMSQDVVGRTFAPVEVFTLLAVLYWALTAALSGVTARLESRLAPHGAAVSPQLENPR
jgi:His/Glu/Gln/Arg/opine family amino acid ABC transporter permease subunit